MKFAYQAFDRSGRAAPGVVEAASASEASESLRQKGLFVTKVVESNDGNATAASGTESWSTTIALNFL